MSEIRIGIVGCGGRMGQALVREVLDSEQATLSGGTERHDSPLVGTAIRHPASGEETGLKISDNAENLFKVSDIVIDFTCPHRHPGCIVPTRKNMTPPISSAPPA